MMLTFVLMLSNLTLIYANTPPVVSNLTATQRTDGTFLVDIYYDVYDAEGDLLEISLQVSDDGGSTWDVDCQLLSGDVGTAIVPDIGKHIVWDMGSEHPDVVDMYKFKVVADDGVVVDVTTGLIAYYPFNGSFENASSHSISSTNYRVMLCPDRFGEGNSATSYNGSSYIRLSPNSLLDIKQSISISCWIMPSNLNNCWFVWRGDTQYARDPYCFGIQNQSLIFRRDYQNANMDGQVITYPIGNDFILNWHHVAGTYDHSQGMYRLYIDGVLVNELVASPTEAAFVTSSFWNCIGAVDNGAQYYKGKLDDLRIYNRLLSSDEIYHLFVH